MEANDLRKTFTLYDIFGYLVPGVAIITGVYVHVKTFGGYQEIENLIRTLFWNWPSTWFEFATLLVLACVLTYMIGHLVASVGALIIDRMLVERLNGYPFEKLFDKVLFVDQKQQKMRRMAQAEHCLMLTSGILLSICSISVWWVYGLLLIAATILVLGALYSAFVDHGMPKAAIWLYRIVSPVVWPASRSVHCVLRLLVYVFQMHRSFPERFQHEFVKTYQRIFGFPPDKMETQVFWLPYAFVVEHSPLSQRLIQNWLHQYSFARNLSTAFLLLFTYGALCMRIWGAGSGGYLAWAIIIGGATLAFGVRYYYLYYNYFSKYVFRSFVALYAQPPVSVPQDPSAEKE